MKIRTTILSAAAAGILTVSQGIGAYAAEPPAQPVDVVPGTIILEKLDLSMNTLTFTYTDIGTDIDTVTYLMASYAPYGVEVDWRDWDDINDTNKMTYLYNSSTLTAGAVQLLSGQTVTITDGQMIGSIRNDGGSRIYYGIITVMEGNNEIVRKVTGVADYNKCMMYFTRGVECVREETPYGRVAYAPYMNGSPVNVTWGETDGVDMTPVNNTDNNEENEENGDGDNTGGADSGGDNSGNNNGDGDSNADTASDGDSNNSDNGASGSETDTTKNEGENDGQEEDGNVGSDSGAGIGGETEEVGESEGGNVSAENLDANDHWAGSSDPGNYANVGLDATYALATYDSGANFAGWGDTVGVENVNEVTEAAEGVAEDVATENATDAEILPEVPELSGEMSKTEQKGIRWWWVIIPLAIAGFGLGMWWIWPIFGKKSKKE